MSFTLAEIKKRALEFAREHAAEIEQERTGSMNWANL